MHYLSDTRFGLWGLMASIAAYLSLIDLGMSGSVGRLLVDHKDDPGRGSYGSLIKTGWLVLATQAALVLIVGYLLAPLLSRALNIQAEVRGEFVALMRWQTTALALGFVMRIFSHILTAHQRIDVINYSQILTLLLNLGLLWFFFEKDCGVFSLAWAALLSAFCGALMLAAACWRLGVFPPRGKWGQPSWTYFQELFGYGKDLFLVAVGAQLIVASQSMIITARVGLIAAGVWYAGTRAFNLISQAIWRISDVSGPAFSEMMVRGEDQLLRERYRAMAILTASLSGFAAVAYALCNSLFVTVVGDWTNHKIEWPLVNDLLLGLWMITNAIQRCHNMFIVQTKRVGFMRYIFFVEGSVYVLAAYLIAPWGQLPGIIACSIICSILFSGAYGVWRICRYFDIHLAEAAGRWLIPMGKVLLFFAPGAGILWWITGGIQDVFFRLLLHAAFSSSVGFYLFLRFGLSDAFQRELLQRAPRRVNPLLRWVFVGVGQ
jgi:O-antigen/teichoic acid export membrane protein